MKAMTVVLGLASVVALAFVLAFQLPSLRAASPREAIDCSAGKVIDVATGWPIPLAKQRSPALALTETPGFDVGLSAYVHQPGLLRYQGATPFTVVCPHMVAVMPQKGKVSAVDVEVVASNPYDFDQAMKLMADWHDRFEGMKLESPPKSVSQGIEPFERVGPFFRDPKLKNLSPIGKSTGAWRNHDEIILLGIERLNVSPMNQLPKFMYIVDISVEDLAMSTTGQ